MKDFGYENVNSDNIISDEVYSLLFKNMLNDNLGIIKEVDIVINQILKEINNK